MEATLGADAPGHGVVVTTGTGSGKTESFLLPVLGRHAEEASKRPANFGERAVRALLLYPMNALVNDRLGLSIGVESWLWRELGAAGDGSRVTPAA